jgi:hypothetical protein
MVRHWVVVLVCLVPASTPLAEETPAVETAASKPLGVELSLRFGPAVLGNNNFTILSGPMFPLELGIGYRFGGLVYVGVAGVYAFGPTEVFNGGLHTLYNAQFLAEVALHPLRYARVDPWIGYGLGGEWFNGGNGGFIPVSLSMGVDFALSRAFRVGPFFTVQVAFNGSDVHEWYVVGLQLTALP